MSGARRTGRLRNETAGSAHRPATIDAQVTASWDVPLADLLRRRPPSRYGGMYVSVRWGDMSRWKSLPTGAVAQTRGECFRGAVGKRVHALAGLHIQDDRPVCVAL